MRSKVFQRRHSSPFRLGLRLRRGCKWSLQAKAVVPTKFTTARGPTLLSYGFSLVFHRFSAVNESRSYGAICSSLVLFVFLRAGFYVGRIPFSWRASNPRVKCNLTVLLHELAAAAGLPLNARYFRIYVIFMRRQWMGCAVGNFIGAQNTDKQTDIRWIWVMMGNQSFDWCETRLLFARGYSTKVLSAYCRRIQRCGHRYLPPHHPVFNWQCSFLENSKFAMSPLLRKNIFGS